MRLLVDENVQQPTVQFLRDLGHAVRWVPEEGLRGAADDVVFRLAEGLQSTLLTYNADFVDLRALAGHRHFGIIRLRISDQRIASVHPILKAALQRVQDMDLRDMLVTLTDDRVRIRKTFPS